MLLRDWSTKVLKERNNVNGIQEQSEVRVSQPTVSYHDKVNAPVIVPVPIAPPPRRLLPATAILLLSVLLLNGELVLLLRPAAAPIELLARPREPTCAGLEPRPMSADGVPCEMRWRWWCSWEGRTRVVSNIVQMRRRGGRMRREGSSCCRGQCDARREQDELERRCQRGTRSGLDTLKKWDEANPCSTTKPILAVAVPDAG